MNMPSHFKKHVVDTFLSLSNISTWYQIFICDNSLFFKVCYKHIIDPLKIILIVFNIQKIILLFHYQSVSSSFRVEDRPTEGGKRWRKIQQSQREGKGRLGLGKASFAPGHRRSKVLLYFIARTPKLWVFLFPHRLRWDDQGHPKKDACSCHQGHWRVRWMAVCWDSHIMWLFFKVESCIVLPTAMSKISQISIQSSKESYH